MVHWVSTTATMPFLPNNSVHDEIQQHTATEASARTFLQTRGVLKSSMTCSCSSPMNLVSCSSSKSADLNIWKCPSCRKSKNIRTDSVLSGAKLSFKTFLTLIFYFSIRGISNVQIAQLSGISENAVGDWRTILSNVIATWFLQNSQPLGGPGVIVEIDEAKFGKRKFNKGAYRGDVGARWGRQRHWSLLPSSLPREQKDCRRPSADNSEVGPARHSCLHGRVVLIQPAYSYRIHSWHGESFYTFRRSCYRSSYQHTRRTLAPCEETNEW